MAFRRVPKANAEGCYFQKFMIFEQDFNTKEIKKEKANFS
jgi:hypothetical protein